MNTVTSNQKDIVDILNLAISVAESGRVGVALKIITDLSESLSGNKFDSLRKKKPEEIFKKANSYILEKYLGVPDNKPQEEFDEEEDWLA